MSGQAGAFEIALAAGEELAALRYGFELPEATDKLMPGGECVLRTARGEHKVTIDRLDELRLAVTAQQPIDLRAVPLTLVVAPWFLYERLVHALEAVAVDRHAVELALALFGKRAPRRVDSPLQGEHADLNASQRAAVQLCCESELAFIWGPPGTGKTATLAHVLDELLLRGKRILLVSTTNAAIDQTLAKLATRPWFAEAVAGDRVIRLGRSEDETFGTEVAEVVARLQGGHRVAIDRLRARLGQVELELRQAEALLVQLDVVTAAQQQLFAAPPRSLRAAEMVGVFAPGLADRVAMMEAREQKLVIARRAARLMRIRVLAKERAARSTAALRELEARVIGEARVVMCTLASAYLSPLMHDARFDVLIAEEAGMATLPSLFYAACLCREQAIMVGDPRQLPPIVHSRDPVVQRTIGRNVFDVTIPDPTGSEIVALLDIQYRMHPVIGALVGRNFYDGRLTHGVELAACEALAARAPHPGRPLIVVDTEGRTVCERSAKGSSRVNLRSADVTAALAAEAAAESAGSVAVITPYAAQAREVRRRLVARGLGEAVECSTIHRFQGRECDVVIIDLVDAAPMRPGLLLAGGRAQSDACHLLNVSVSRARGKLIFVADVGYFEAQAPAGIVTAILREAIRDGLRVSAA